MSGGNMSVGNKTYVAQQETLVEVRDKIGNTDDTGGSYNSGTVNGKINTAILGISGVNNGIEGLNNRLDGVVTPYGKGTYGDLVVGTDFAWPSQDGFNRYVIHTKSMTIPEGVTLKPPEKCDGLYILSQGDVTINGVIDVRGMRKTFTEDLQLAPTINVGSQEFVLAKGGYSPKGGKNGAGGANRKVFSGTTSRDGLPSPSIETDSISGNVNGGGTGRYALGGSSVVIDRDGGDNKVRDYNAAKYYGDKNTINSTTRYGVFVRFVPELVYNTAPCALIIIAKGTVTVNGNILAGGSQGKDATEALPYQFDMSYGPSSPDYIDFTTAGDGAMPPSGGGPVTVICNIFECNGKIDTNGRKETYSNKPDKRTVVPQQNRRINSSGDVISDNGGSSYVFCSQGGFGGTFISTAGEIKVYTGVSE